jgi:hypothetical protein
MKYKAFSYVNGELKSALGGLEFNFSTIIKVFEGFYKNLPSDSRIQFVIVDENDDLVTTINQNSIGTFKKVDDAEWNQIVYGK